MRLLFGALFLEFDFQVHALVELLIELLDSKCSITDVIEFCEGKSTVRLLNNLQGNQRTVSS